MTTTHRTTGGATTLPRLLSVEEAATMLAVSASTIRNWIDDETIPYVELPPTGQRRRFRIPLQGLLNSLSGNYDLAAELRELDEGVTAAAPSDDTEFRGGRRPREGDPPEEVHGDGSDGVFAHAEARNK
jgi:excisionase family DNA binding protein